MRRATNTLTAVGYLVTAGLLSAAQNITMAASPYESVTIAPISTSNANSVFSGHLALLQPACLFLSNRDSRGIVAVLATWVTTTSAGKRQLHRHSTDSLQSTKSSPVLAPGSRMVVAPGLWVPEAMITSLTGSPRLTNLEQLADIFAAASSVEVQIDSIIFSDGEIVGPDVQHFADELRERKQAAVAVVRAVENARADGKSPFDILSQMRAQNSGARGPGIVHRGAAWTRLFAESLLHTTGDSFDRRVTELAEMPAISVHRIQRESRGRLRRP